METKYIISIDGSSYKPMYEHMISELYGLNNVSVVIDVPKDSFLKSLLLKSKMRRITKGKLDFIYSEKNELSKMIEELYDSNIRLCVLFFNASLHYNPYLPGTLKAYKKRWPNLRYVMYYIDIIDSPVSHFANLAREEGVFDLIYTIDKNDQKKIGCKLWNTIYSKVKKYNKIQVDNDIYFCGVSKNRGFILSQCIESARKKNVNVVADVICYEDKNLLEKYDEIKLLPPGEFRNYKEVLSNELKARCILEIVQKGQSASTLRPFEAVVYNKKLLTNNKSILEFKYYDPRFMRVFNSVEDIDWEWVTNSEAVNYNYQGDFSPELLLEDIRKRLDINKGEIC